MKLVNKKLQVHESALLYPQVARRAAPALLLPLSLPDVLSLLRLVSKGERRGKERLSPRH